MTIGQLAKVTGVPGHALRRLVAMGAIPGKRPPRGYWRIEESTVPEIKRLLEQFGLMTPQKRGRK